MISMALLVAAHKPGTEVVVPEADRIATNVFPVVVVVADDVPTWDTHQVLVPLRSELACLLSPLLACDTGGGMVVVLSMLAEKLARFMFHLSLPC